MLVSGRVCSPALPSDSQPITAKIQGKGPHFHHKLAQQQSPPPCAFRCKRLWWTYRLSKTYPRKKGQLGGHIIDAQNTRLIYLSIYILYINNIYYIYDIYIYIYRIKNILSLIPSYNHRNSFDSIQAAGKWLGQPSLMLQHITNGSCLSPLGKIGPKFG